MKTLFHIMSHNSWIKFQSDKTYKPESLACEGFIHASRPHQLVKTAKRFYHDQKDLVVLIIDEDHIDVEVKYEPADDDVFPHIYGVLDLKAIKHVYEFTDSKLLSSSKEVSGNDLGFFNYCDKISLVGDTFIRPAMPGDEAEIASVLTHSWMESYKGIVDQSYLDNMPLSFRSRYSWVKANLCNQNGFNTYMNAAKELKTAIKAYVAESCENGIVAFISFGVSRDEDRSHQAEIRAFYCLQSFQRKSYGSALLKMALNSLKSDYKTCYLWTLKNNPSRTFYVKNGGQLMTDTKTIKIIDDLDCVGYSWQLNT